MCNRKSIDTMLFILIVLTMIWFFTTYVFSEEQQQQPQQQDTYTKVVVTAYCKCILCCGKESENGITASGKVAKANHTIAADPKQYPFGTLLFIPGLGLRVVEDTGGAIHQNRIDVYFDLHQEALNFGRQTKYIKEFKHGYSKQPRED